MPYVPDPENITLIKTAYNLCMHHEARIDALRCAIMLNDVDLMKKIVLDTSDTLVSLYLFIAKRLNLSAG